MESLSHSAASLRAVSALISLSRSCTCLSTSLCTSSSSLLLSLTSLSSASTYVIAPYSPLGVALPRPHPLPHLLHHFLQFQQRPVWELRRLLPQSEWLITYDDLLSERSRFWRRHPQRLRSPLGRGPRPQLHWHRAYPWSGRGLLSYLMEERLSLQRARGLPPASHDLFESR